MGSCRLLFINSRTLTEINLVVYLEWDSLITHNCAENPTVIGLTHVQPVRETTSGVTNPVMCK